MRCPKSCIPPAGPSEASRGGHRGLPLRQTPLPDRFVRPGRTALRRSAAAGVDAYDGVDIPGPAVGDWCAGFGRATDPEKNPDAAYGDFGAAYVKNSKKHYYASVTFIDEQIGLILRALRARGAYDDALICFVSDHGDMMGDHHHWRKTYAFFTKVRRISLYREVSRRNLRLSGSRRR